MLTCPGCGGKLLKLKSALGTVLGCPKCGGSALSIDTLGKDRADAGFVRNLWLDASHSTQVSDRKCPQCDRRMKPVHSAEAGADLDVCPACHIVWFDPSEYQRVPKLNIREAPSQMTQALANAPSKPRPRVVAGDSALPPDSIDGTWKYIPGLFGLPVEYDWEPVNRKPVAVWAVTAIAALCLIPAYFAPRELFLSYGFTPADWARHDGLTIITSFFLHDGIFHLLINFYFLMVFGDNVEDDLGPLKFIGLLIAAHIAGLAMHSTFDPRPGIPLVGASGGISGVLAYYALTFPKNRVGLFLLYLYWWRISAWTAFIMFFVIQLVYSYLETTGWGNVSYLGHLGGLIVGCTAAIVTRLRK